MLLLAGPELLPPAAALQLPGLEPVQEPRDRVRQRRVRRAHELAHSGGEDKISFSFTGGLRVSYWQKCDHFLAETREKCSR